LPEHPPRLEPLPDGRTVIILVVGVNGTGKTTSSAKLGLWLKTRKFSVLLAAADTFRAAAVEQLERWGSRIDIPVITGNPTDADPSSVCFRRPSKSHRRWHPVPHL
jgi:fused signal recognition particle receptor